MSTLDKVSRAAFGKILLNELRLAKRTPISLLLGLGIPVLLLVIYGSIPSLHQADKSLGGQSYFAVAVPVLIGFSITAVAFMSLPNNLVTYREKGILRRLSTTPVPPLWLLAAQVVVNVCVVLVGLVLLIGGGIVAFNLSSPKNIPGLVIAVLLTILSIFAVGLWLSAIARNNGSARAVGGILFYLMLFFGGLWIPRQTMPQSLLNVSNWTPLGAGVAGIQDSFQGHFPSGQPLLCLVIYTLVFGYLAVRYFRWE